MATGVRNLSFKPKAVGDFKGAAQGGAPLLREADRAVGLTRRLAGRFADRRSQERVERAAAGRPAAVVPGYEDLNDKLRDDSSLALAGDDLTGENQVRGRDRSHPLARTLNRPEPGVPGDPRRYKKADTKKMDDLQVDLFLEAPPPCAS